MDKESMIADRVYKANNYIIYEIENNTYIKRKNKLHNDTIKLGHMSILCTTNYGVNVLNNDDTEEILIIDYYGDIAYKGYILENTEELRDCINRLALNILTDKNLYNEYRDRLVIQEDKEYILAKDYDVSTDLVTYRLYHTSHIGKYHIILVDTTKNKILANYTGQYDRGRYNTNKFNSYNKDCDIVFGRQLRYITHTDKRLDWTAFFDYNKCIKLVPTTLSYIKGGINYTGYKILIGNDKECNKKVICKVTNRVIKYIEVQNRLEITGDNIFITVGIESNLQIKLRNKLNKAVNQYIREYNPLMYNIDTNKLFNIVDTKKLVINESYIWLKMEHIGYNTTKIVYIGISIRGNNIMILDTSTSMIEKKELI